MATADDILRLRLRRQLVEGEGAAAPADVVDRLCAVQAQDYAGALWAVGLRCRPLATVGDVERAIAERRVVRTWPMRGTLHLVAAADVRWMLSLLAPRALARAASRHRQLGLDEAVFDRAREVFSEALAGGRILARADMMALLEAAGIATAGQRGVHVLWTLAQQGLLCCGPVRGAQQTFVLLDEWIPPPRRAGRKAPAREGALSRLAARYAAGHGPATVADLAWWAGITKTDARAALAAAAGGLERVELDGVEHWTAGGPGAASAASPAVHLLPGFDEYMLGYTDRRAQLGKYRETYGSTVASNGMFSATLVVDGRIAGIWKRALGRRRVAIEVKTFRRLRRAEAAALAGAADAYGRHLGVEPELSVSAFGRR